MNIYWSESWIQIKNFSLSVNELFSTDLSRSFLGNNEESFRHLTITYNTDRWRLFLFFLSICLIHELEITTLKTRSSEAASEAVVDSAGKMNHTLISADYQLQSDSSLLLPAFKNTSAELWSKPQITTRTHTGKQSFFPPLSGIRSERKQRSGYWLTQTMKLFSRTHDELLTGVWTDITGGTRAHRTLRRPQITSDSDTVLLNCSAWSSGFKSLFSVILSDLQTPVQGYSNTHFLHPDHIRPGLAQNPVYLRLVKPGQDSHRDSEDSLK